VWHVDRSQGIDRSLSISNSTRDRQIPVYPIHHLHLWCVHLWCVCICGVCAFVVRVHLWCVCVCGVCICSSCACVCAIHTVFVYRTHMHLFVYRTRVCMSLYIARTISLCACVCVHVFVHRTHHLHLPLYPSLTHSFTLSIPLSHALPLYPSLTASFTLSIPLSHALSLSPLSLSKAVDVRVDRHTHTCFVYMY